VGDIWIAPRQDDDGFQSLKRLFAPDGVPAEEEPFLIITKPEAIRYDK
jgi:hypothetical protein